MGVTESAPRELLSVAYTSSGTSTTTTANGAALSVPWGGSFTVGARTTVDIEIDVPLTNLSVGGATSFFEIDVMLDGACKLKIFHHSATATYSAFSGSRKVRVSGLSVGTHTIAVQLQVSSGTGTLAGAADNPGRLTVREVA